MSKGILANIWSRLVNDGGLVLGAPHQTITPVTGRDIPANGANYLRSAYPRIGAVAPALPAGFLFSGGSYTWGSSNKPFMVVPGGGIAVALLTTGQVHAKSAAGVWSSLNMATYFNNAIVTDACYGNGVWVFATSKGIYRSTDNLATAPTLVINSVRPWLSVWYDAASDRWGAICANVGNVYTGGYVGEVDASFKMRTSADNGVTWAAEFTAVANDGHGSGYKIEYTRAYLRASGGKWYFFYRVYDGSGNFNPPFYYWTGVPSAATTTKVTGVHGGGTLDLYAVDILLNPDNGSIYIFYLAPVGGSAYRRELLAGSTVINGQNVKYTSFSAPASANDPASLRAALYQGSLIVMGHATSAFWHELTVTVLSQASVTDINLAASGGLPAGVANYIGVTQNGFVAGTADSKYEEDYATVRAPYFAVPTINTSPIPTYICGR